MEGKAAQLLFSENGVYYNTSDSEHVDLDGQVHALRERKGGRATEPFCKISLLLCQADLSQRSRRYAIYMPSRRSPSWWLGEEWCPSSK